MGIGVAFYHSKKDIQAISAFITNLQDVSKVFVIISTKDDGDEKASMENKYAQIITQLMNSAETNCRDVCPPSLQALKYNRNKPEDLMRKICIEIHRERTEGRNGICKVDLSSANSIECFTVGRLSLVADIDVVVTGDDQPKIDPIPTVVLLKDTECRIIDSFMESEEPFTNQMVMSKLDVNSSTSSRATMYLADTGCSLLDPDSGARNPAYRIVARGIYMRLLADRFDEHRNLVFGGARTEPRYKRYQRFNRIWYCWI